MLVSKNSQSLKTWSGREWNSSSHNKRLSNNPLGQACVRKNERLSQILMKPRNFSYHWASYPSGAVAGSGWWQIWTNLWKEFLVASSEDNGTFLTEFVYQMRIERKGTVIEYLLRAINVLGAFIYFSSFPSHYALSIRYNHSHYYRSSQI